MPTQLEGSVEDRFAYLDRIDRRCIANGAYCINAAVDEFDVIVNSDGTEQILKTCGRHRMHVLGSSKYTIKDHRQNCLSGSSELRRLAA